MQRAGRMSDVTGVRLSARAGAPGRPAPARPCAEPLPLVQQHWSRSHTRREIASARGERARGRTHLNRKRWVQAARDWWASTRPLGGPLGGRPRARMRRRRRLAPVVAAAVVLAVVLSAWSRQRGPDGPRAERLGPSLLARCGAAHANDRPCGTSTHATAPSAEEPPAWTTTAGTAPPVPSNPSTTAGRRRSRGKGCLPLAMVSCARRGSVLLSVSLLSLSIISNYVWKSPLPAAILSPLRSPGEGVW